MGVVVSQVAGESQGPLCVSESSAAQGAASAVAQSGQWRENSDAPPFASPQEKSGGITVAASVARFPQTVSYSQISFDLAEYTADVDGVGTLRLLDAVKTCGLINSVKFYQASTSELYGKVQEIPQKETTPFYPRSPYGAAKLYAYWIVVNFREAYNLFAVNGILFNHESPRRGRRRPRGLSASGFAEPGLGRGSLATGLRQPSVLFCGDDDVCLTGVSRGPVRQQCTLLTCGVLVKQKQGAGANFVTRKISRSVAKIYLGQLECFSLGNLDAKRDWGHAKDYVE
ncbi:hypothetical protein E2I00_012958, partial [Balaenoptera physalus]